MVFDLSAPSPQVELYFFLSTLRGNRAVARTLIGGGGVYSYMDVLPD